MSQSPASPVSFYLASSNAHKAQELAVLLQGEGLQVEVRAAQELGGMPEVEENAATFTGNATLKALALWRKAPAGSLVLADDSGLEVDALQGAPGVRSARYAGERATDADNRQKLLQELSGVQESACSARFRCVLVLVDAEGHIHDFDGTSEGTILSAERGQGGFGYDPLFVPQGDTRSYAEMSMQEKNRSSHRARAVQALAQWWLQQ